MYNGMVKGFYHDQRKHAVDDKCLGTWMQGSFENMYKIADHLNDGEFRLISKDLSISAMTDMIDLFYKNVDYCNFEAVIGTYQNWCLNNMDICSMERTDIFSNV